MMTTNTDPPPAPDDAPPTTLPPPAVMVVTRAQLDAGYLACFQVGWPLMPMVARKEFKVLEERADGTSLVAEPTP